MGERREETGEMRDADLAAFAAVDDAVEDMGERRDE